MPAELVLDEVPDAMPCDAFWNLVGTLETERTEFKGGAVSAELTDAYAALAMTSGGLIVLGVRDQDRAIIGCELSQKVYDRIMKAAHEVGVEIRVKAAVIDDVPVVLVGVPEIRGRIVTTPDGRLLRRVGSDNQPLRSDALQRFVIERSHTSAEAATVPVFDPSDIDLELVNGALNGLGRAAVASDEMLRALSDLGVAEPPTGPAGTAVSRAALIVFGTETSARSVGCRIQAVRRVGVGPGPSSARVELAGPLPRLVEQAIAFIDTHISSQEAVVGLHRERVAEYPRPALREAIMNAVSHRDYGLKGATVDISIYDDRIEIQSPGPLPGHITTDNMRDEHYSRNPRIMAALKALALVDEFGEGIDRIYREMEARLLEPPIFVASATSVTVTLRNRALASVDDQVWLSLLGQYELSVSERRLLIVARNEGSATKRRMRELLPHADLDRLFNSAVAKGLVRLVGERGGSRYLLTDEVTLRAGTTGLDAQSRKRQMLLDEIRQHGSLSTKEAADLLGEDMRDTRRLLNDLATSGAVEARGRTRARRYHLA